VTQRARRLCVYKNSSSNEHSRLQLQAQKPSPPPAARCASNMETPPKKVGFSMSNAATGAKRSAEPTAGSKKIPKVADMKVEAPRQQSQRPQMNAPVNLCVYKCTENSGDLWSAFPDTKLWQIQLEHDARPSMSVNIIASLNDFLKEASKTSSGGVPDTVQKLQSEAGIKLTLTNMDDPDGRRDGGI